MKRERKKSEKELQAKILRQSSTIGGRGVILGQQWRTYSAGYDDVVTLSEDVISWDGNGRAKWHECNHTTRRTITRQPSWSWEYSKDYYAREYGYYDPGYSRTFNNTGEVSLQVGPQEFTSDLRFYVPEDSYLDLRDPVKDPDLLSSIDWGTAWEQLMDDAAGLMPSDYSVGVNIAEFASLRALVPGLARSVRRILKYVRGQPNKTVRRYRYLFDKRTGKRIPWTATIETVKLRSLSWSLRDLASLHLGFNFGVLPLADDLGNWAGKLYQVQQHLNWLRSRRTTFWAHARTNTVTTERDTRKSSTAGGNRPKWTVESGIYSSLTGNLHAEFQAELKTGSAFYNALLSQVLGLNVPMQLAWDLVPFSFVVDWFLPIGKLISRIEPRRAFGSLTRRLNVLQTWYSLQGETKWLSQVTSLSGNPDLSYQLIDPGRMEKSITTFIRSRGTPTYNLIPTGKIRYGGKQFLLSLSLLAQRFTSRR